MLHSPIELYYWYKSIGLDPDSQSRRNQEPDLSFLGLVPIDYLVQGLVHFPNGTRQHLFLPQGDYFKEVSLFSFTVKEKGLYVKDGVLINGYYAADEKCFHTISSMRIWGGKKDDCTEAGIILSAEELMKGYFIKI